MDYDAIVIGVGAMGAATLEQLSRRGIKALGIEQSSVPNANGSSGGDSRLIRKAYFEHPDYVPLLERAYHNWRDVETRSGERLLFETGAVYIGPPDGELIAGSLAAAREHGLGLDELSAADVERHHPQFRVPPGCVAGHEPAAGFVMSGRSISAFATLALQQGAHLLTYTRVDDWEATANGVSVITSQGTFNAERLVIAGGCWNGRLLHVPDLSLTVTRQPLFWVSPNRPSQFALDGFPCWAVERGDYGGVFYGFPDGMPGAAQAGVKFAHHHPGQPCQPDDARREPDVGEYRQLADAVAPFLPELDGTLLAGTTCLYTMSRDQHFIVDAHPEHRNVVFAAGFSGHGFKFASVMGELLADYAVDGGSRLPGDFLRIGNRDLWNGAAGGEVAT